MGLLGMALPLATSAASIETKDWVMVRTTSGHQIAYREDGEIMLSDDVMAYPDRILAVEPMNSANALRLLDTATSMDKDALQETIRLWDTRQLTYSIDAKMPDGQRQAITGAIAEWNDKTVFRFVPESGSSPMVALVPTSRGCRAHLGMPSPGKGPAKVELGSTCDKQSVIHELGHIVGMNHEHQRATRDKNIRIRQDTLEHIRQVFPSLYHTVLFNLQRIESNVGDPFPFDYQSVMLYGSYPRNNLQLEADLRERHLPLFTDIDGRAIVRPTSGLTNKDINRANRIDLLRYWVTSGFLFR